MCKYVQEYCASMCKQTGAVPAACASIMGQCQPTGRTSFACSLSSSASPPGRYWVGWGRLPVQPSSDGEGAGGAVTPAGSSSKGWSEDGTAVDQCKLYTTVYTHTCSSQLVLQCLGVTSRLLQHVDEARLIKVDVGLVVCVTQTQTSRKHSRSE